MLLNESIASNDNSGAMGAIWRQIVIHLTNYNFY